ncbi:hypothetical protein EGT67_08055 [Prescottella agglutinans]|uniref:DUF3093 domain-containing protein n=1 Tax=Prescottella agglutinans TaxID=1644129 RepID=A0A3S3AHD9_9NOCA|nr:hypothetical protein [Prescottella agglutinans]RVW10153.1 hypothetical protein EGT67_08055 [Prescottella agglutinans]
MSGSDAGSPAEPDVLFDEPGARWRTVAYGPVFCVVALVIELLTGPVVHWFALTLFAAILAGIVYVQVAAARRHVSVSLTRTTLRQGAEELPVAEIEAVLPAADPYADDPEPWESARSLGELSGVPRRRTAIGLRLRDGSLVQAWARDDDGLRDALTEALAGVDGTSA